MSDINLLEIELERTINPLDMIEQVASGNDWVFERSSDDEICIVVAGGWTEYHVSFSWMEEVEALHLACGFDLSAPKHRAGEITQLVSLINEQLLIGHFDVWAGAGTVMFRQALPLNGGAEPTGQQLEYLLGSALEACERYFQAFQFVAWAGHDARRALDGALFETCGTA